jgi:H+/gluconate symporter-like permease
MLILQINAFCQELSPILQLIGQALNLFKIFLPLILIALGILDIGKAIISSKSEDVKKNMKNFFKKVIACVVVFFIPTICMIVFGFVGGFNDIKENSGVDYDVCYSCMFNPSNDECTNAVEIASSDY